MQFKNKSILHFLTFWISCIESIANQLPQFPTHLPTHPKHQISFYTGGIMTFLLMVQHFWETKKKTAKERESWLHQTLVNFDTDCCATTGESLIININESFESMNVDGSAKSKSSSRVLTKFLRENIREKLKCKGLSLSAPKQKRRALWLFYHQMTNSYAQGEGECA